MTWGLESSHWHMMITSWQGCMRWDWLESPPFKKTFGNVNQVWSSCWLVWWASSLIYGHHKSRFDEMSLNEWVGIVTLMANVGALATSWAWLLVIAGSIHYLVSIDCPRIHMKAHGFPLELTPSCMCRVDIGWVMNPREYERGLAYVEATSPST